MKKKVCPVCGAVFETIKRNKKYCSLTCREAGKKVKAKTWHDNNPDYMKKYSREYYLKSKLSNQ